GNHGAGAGGTTVFLVRGQDLSLALRRDAPEREATLFVGSDDLYVTGRSRGAARPVQQPGEFHLNPNLPPGLRLAVRVEELPADLGCARDDQRHLRGCLGNVGDTGEPAGVVPRVEE